MGKCTWPSAAGPDLDELVKVTAADTTANYLGSKVVAGANIALAVVNPGANEQLQITASGGLSADYAPEFLHAELWQNPDDTGTLLNDTLGTAEIRLRVWQMVQNTILSFQTIIPVLWTGAPISAKFFFYMSSDSSPDTHTFSVGARAIKEDEAINVAIPYSNTMSGTASGVSGRAFFTTVSFTPANTPAAGDGLFLKFKRTDDESGTLRFIGAKLHWRIQ